MCAMNKIVPSSNQKIGRPNFRRFLGLFLVASVLSGFSIFIYEVELRSVFILGVVVSYFAFKALYYFVSEKPVSYLFWGRF